jgi:hypothetical protein
MHGVTPKLTYYLKEGVRISDGGAEGPAVVPLGQQRRQLRRLGDIG